MAGRAGVPTRAQLRAYAVTRSLFRPLDLLGAIERLGFVQIDPIRSPARAQDLILRHRVVGYRVGDLDLAYPDLPVAEDHLHVYGVMPKTVQRLLHPRATAHVWRVENEHPTLARSIVAHVRRHGPTHPAMLEKALGRIGTVNAWGGRSNASTRMLEALHHRGILRVRHRENGIKVYEIAAKRERALSAATRARGVLSLLLRLYAPLPEPTLARLARMVGNSVLPDELRDDALRRLLRSTAVRRASVDGLAYAWPAEEALDVQAPDQVRLFAPFDPVVWDRRRFEHLWGWAYRFEAYTPAAKRRIGYYALPLLWRDAVIGWANVSGGAEAGARRGKLDIALGFVERRPASAVFSRALDAEIARLEQALGSRSP